MLLPWPVATAAGLLGWRFLAIVYRWWRLAGVLLHWGVQFAPHRSPYILAAGTHASPLLRSYHTIATEKHLQVHPLVVCVPARRALIV